MQVSDPIPKGPGPVACPARRRPAPDPGDQPANAPGTRGTGADPAHRGMTCTSVQAWVRAFARSQDACHPDVFDGKVDQRAHLARQDATFEVDRAQRTGLTGVVRQ